MINKIFEGDCSEILKTFTSGSINMCMTSPPYWGLRDYGEAGQLGLEPDFNEYINKLCNIFDEIKRVLKNEGTCWVNLGDTYSTQSGSMGDEKFKQPKYEAAESSMNFKQHKTSLPDKCLCQIPQRFSIEMCNRGWILRNTIIWHKPNCMPASVKDRFTVDFEYLFFFVKNKKYYFEQQFEEYLLDSLKRNRRGNCDNKYSADNHLPGKVHANTMSKKRNHKGYDNLQEEFDNHPGRNKRTVWAINTKGYKEAHFATYPEELCETPIKAGCPEGGIILDPFFGSGTTGAMSLKLDRKFVGIEINKKYIEIANKRIEPILNQGKLF